MDKQLYMRQNVNYLWNNYNKSLIVVGWQSKIILNTRPIKTFWTDTSNKNRAII